ncbi:hypothetical protein DRB17_05010 [Ferruginivarius sediminum]|uniref:Uncharacterized protein n=1 Tax=Ferruginivarius sediminum TaxID=2661937 RepID=A0A369TCS1_9PROT|nr:hypothetical protein DRB17_05010 [Ferruginivarius sediminum]
MFNGWHIVAARALTNLYVARSFALFRAKLAIQTDHRARLMAVAAAIIIGVPLMAVPRSMGF